MQDIVKWILVFLLGLPWHLALAQTQTEEMSVKLKSIEPVRPQEKRGDEIFLNITEFPANERARHYRVPEYPGHWLSKYVANIKDIVIWKKDLNACESIDLLISLTEEDLPPWDVNDILGAVELKVECIDGKAVERWTIPNPKNTRALPQEQNAFSFVGEHAEYHLIFSLDNRRLKENIQSKPEPSELEINRVVPFP